MDSDGLWAEEKPLCDLTVGETVRDQGEHVELAPGRLEGTGVGATGRDGLHPCPASNVISKCDEWGSPQLDGRGGTLLERPLGEVAVAVADAVAGAKQEG